MPGDPLTPVHTGDPFRFPAAFYNDLIQVVKWFKSRSQQAGGARGSTLLGGEILLKNSSGSNLDRFAVLGISDALISPADNPDGFAEIPAATGVTPTADHEGGRFAVLVEPIADGGLGRAVSGGICVCKVNVTDASHDFADAASGNSSALVSAESGPVQLLWKESGTGSGKSAIGRFGGGGTSSPSPVKFGKIASYTAGSNQVTLDPCASDGTDNGDANVTCYIELPTTKTVCSFFSGVVGNVLAYMTADGVSFLVSYPRPHSTTDKDVFQITSTNGTGGFMSVRFKA